MPREKSFRDPLHPRTRFRHVVRKVMALHRGTAVLARRGAGAEPGVDPRRVEADVELGGIRQRCAIEIVDYSAVRCTFRRMPNREFVTLMNDPEASAREPWVKVRWINIGGMSWDVIKAVSIKHELHPLALDDVFHAHARARSKADYYPGHLFLRVLCHELGEVEEAPAFAVVLDGVSKGLPPSELSVTDGTDSAATLRDLLHKPHPALHTSFHGEPHDEKVDATDERRTHDAAVRVLSGKERVSVTVSPMFIFLCRDGTVISIRSTPNLDMSTPIANRLRQTHTGLRTSADASLLVQSLLSLLVDEAHEVIDAYKDKIMKFKNMMIVKPSIDMVLNLHVLSADLIRHRRTLAPITTVVEALRRYDKDRVAALLDLSAPGTKIVGFMSFKTITYLVRFSFVYLNYNQACGCPQADVDEHMEHVLSQLDVIAADGQNLVDYTFNMISYEMNEVMRRLTLVTIIFLPLTLLAGYFGMNFTQMWSVQGHSDWFFWAVALPIMAVVVPLFVGPDILRSVQYMKKRLLVKKVVVKSFRTG
ncbi:hypothetical protein B0H15DRAFT_809799 [Mycena belliarum]|uniref:Magnesium transporter n=1 Tax=Mycena belliarum TaxID=1033014 RepID=A0AAD6XWS3_9AGAR|nr:hypothetical protein B0H15DRAFT_809799 [Mycena belliae]